MKAEKYLFATLIFLFCSHISWSQILDFNPSLADFGVVYSKDSKSVTVKVSNNTARYLTIYQNKVFNKYFSCDDTAFVLAPYGQKDITIYFKPLHNIIHASELFLFIKDHGTQSYHLYGQGRYRESYYDSTENQSEEPLKTILKSIIGKNYNGLGYNGARDQMFMQFDNGKINGNGDTVNTLECVYTGRLIKNYASRSDAQTNYNFNTEHTWPQSLFSSQEPMLSDLHHLFPVDENANSTRSNNPFGMVANPSWQQGGSKSAGGVFEPRDVHKARAARALFYVAIRYQNYNNFLNSQEKILKEWNALYAPTKMDSARNEAIYKLQKNRNPFIDHPELADRITSISGTSKEAFNDSFYLYDSVISLTANLQDTLLYNVSATGLGNQTVLFSNIQSKLFTKTVGAISCDPGFSGNLNLQYIANAAGTFLDTISMECSHSKIKKIYIPVRIAVQPSAINSKSLSGVSFSIFPNPSKGMINIYSDHIFQPSLVKIYNIMGQKISENILYLQENKDIYISNISGIYYVEIVTQGASHIEKVIIE